MKKDVTIHDVAAAAGVSAGTVHRALYGKPGVSAALRQEILHLADEMNYQPGPTPAMRSRRTHRIVVALPGCTRENHFFFSRMWDGCRQQLEDLAAYHLDVVEAPFDDTPENGFAAQLARIFRQYRLDESSFQRNSHGTGQRDFSRRSPIVHRAHGLLYRRPPGR